MCDARVQKRTTRTKQLRHDLQKVEKTENKEMKPMKVSRSLSLSLAGRGDKQVQLQDVSSFFDVSLGYKS